MMTTTSSCLSPTPLIIKVPAKATASLSCSAHSRKSRKAIPYHITGRSPGDIAVGFADPFLASSQLNWKARRSLADMCTDTWCWQSRNPDGYP